MTELLACASLNAVFVSDSRWYLGGLRAAHAVAEIGDDDGVGLGPSLYDMLVHGRRRHLPLRIEREG